MDLSRKQRYLLLRCKYWIRASLNWEPKIILYLYASFFVAVLVPPTAFLVIFTGLTLWEIANRTIEWAHFVEYPLDKEDFSFFVKGDPAFFRLKEPLDEELPGAYTGAIMFADVGLEERVRVFFRPDNLDTMEVEERGRIPVFWEEIDCPPEVFPLLEEEDQKAHVIKTL
jgi:hypothetical protein